ncbi:MAG: cupin domain-containing protein [Bacteroidota bacterium]
MADTTVTKVDSRYSPKGEMGQKYLASGIHVSMRLWEDVQPGDDMQEMVRHYETVGFVIKGRAELHIEGQVILLEEGNSWVVPKGSLHSYTIVESFTAVEATSPPAQVNDRDDA